MMRRHAGGADVTLMAIPPTLKRMTTMSQRGRESHDLTSARELRGETRKVTHRRRSLPAPVRHVCDGHFSLMREARHDG
jgi:hypothetical protein